MAEERFRYRNPSPPPPPKQPSDPDGSYTPSRTEEFTIAGDRVVAKVMQLLREGSALSITIKDRYGNRLFDVPMSVGVIGTVLFPSLAGLAVIGALMADVRVVVEHRMPPGTSEDAPEDDWETNEREPFDPAS